MKIPLSWLDHVISLEATPHKLGQMLTSLGLEVEGMESQTPDFQGVVVGKVTRVQKHPDAENLKIATVSDGNESYRVVCGAPNCREGLKVAFAKDGAKVGAAKIKKTKLRGVESFGMLCSGHELGITEENEGIIEFDAHLQEGADVALIYADTVLDISLTPNLGHAASMIGVARELAALTDATVNWPEIHLEEAGEAIEKKVVVEVEDPDKCPRYGCRMVEGIKIGPSPSWMQKRLLQAGFRPINNVVDVTNYVQLELGHPLHAFDYQTIAGQKIIVKTAVAGEKFQTLDGKEHLLKENDLLICDEKRPLAIAGIMGGLNSEVKEGTETVLLEAAYFHPSTVRKSSKRLGIVTESSRRFERQADPNLVPFALDRAASLIAEIAGGKVLKGRIDVKAKEFPKKEIKCRLSRINALLGMTLSTDEVESVFRRLEMEPSWDGQDTFSLKVPTYRADVNAEIDLIEEAVRIYGYDKISRKGGSIAVVDLSHSPIFLFERKVRSELLAQGLQEFLTCDLIGPKLLEVVKEIPIEKASQVHVLNPTSIDQSILRTSLLPGLLEVVKRNADRQINNVSGFEVGRIHFKEEEGYREKTMAAIILCGKRVPHHFNPKPQSVDFYDLKGIIENLLTAVNCAKWSFKASSNPVFHPGRQASLWIAENEIGTIGEIHPSIQKRLDVTERIYFAELNLHGLILAARQEIHMKPLPEYPGSDRDWTVTLKEEAAASDVLEILQNIPSRLLESVTVSDVYASDALGVGVKNVTFHFIYRDLKKTISQQACDLEHERLIAKCTEKLTTFSGGLSHG